MRRFSQRNSLVTLSDINITPLLDLAFVLLIIFILITPSIRSSEEYGMDLNLPQGGGPYERVNTKNVWLVEIDPSGTFMLNRQRLSLSQIERRLIAERRRNPDLVVKIRADERVLTKDLVAVFNICQEHKIKMALAEKPPGRR